MTERIAPSPALASLLVAIWRQLARATADRRAGWRHPGLATLDATGAPRIRTLVLRAVDQDSATLTLHTDSRSAKVAEIARDPRVALLFWDPARRQQLRAEGSAAIAEDSATFAALPAASCALYTVEPAPGTPIAEPGQVAQADGAGNFRLLRVRVAALEWLDLADTHRRARFNLSTRAASWLVP